VRREPGERGENGRRSPGSQLGFAYQTGANGPSGPGRPFWPVSNRPLVARAGIVRRHGEVELVVSGLVEFIGRCRPLGRTTSGACSAVEVSSMGAATMADADVREEVATTKALTRVVSSTG
jgi:hypothetical protein